MIDQNKLKHAEQDVANVLVNKGFNLPLVEDANDVVWFAVIHQNAYQLNMHLWFAKKVKRRSLSCLKMRVILKENELALCH
ncbi:hypothetical protein [Leuconostoc citreum]|uniref:hypothetical protein n=1 Tax=Leuconostoc citreum TaxID=33964 RepID=UPI0032DF6FD8